MESVAEQLKNINEKLNLIKTENKFISKRLESERQRGHDIDSRTAKLDEILLQISELENVDKKQDYEISQLLSSILQTSDRVTTLYQSLYELKQSGIVERERVRHQKLKQEADPNKIGLENESTEKDIHAVRSGAPGPDNVTNKNAEFEKSSVQRKVTLNKDGDLKVALPAEQNLLLYNQSSVESQPVESPSTFVNDLSMSHGSVITQSCSTLKDGESTDNQTGSAASSGGVQRRQNHSDIGNLVTVDQVEQESYSNLNQLLSGDKNVQRFRRRRTKLEFDNRIIIMSEQNANDKKLEKKQVSEPLECELLITQDQKTSDDAQLVTENKESEDGQLVTEKRNRLEDVQLVNGNQKSRNDRRNTSLSELQMVGADYWFEQAKLAAVQNNLQKHEHGEGPDTVFVLDTSASMEGEGFQQLKNAFKEIINEYARHRELDLNVAVITFGHEVKFAQYFSNDYYKILHCLDNVQCEGPSPLAAGITMTIGAFQGGAGTSVIGKWHVLPKVILISDGRVTDSRYLNGPEDTTVYDQNQAKGGVMNILEQLGKKYPLFCIPVGDPDMSVLETISALSRGGKIVHIHEARQLGRTPHNMRIARSIQGTGMIIPEDKESIRNVLQNSNLTDEFTDGDLDEIFELLTNKELYKPFDHEEEDEEGEMYEETNPSMPCLGTRVRRGPDWRYDDQDSNGAGTVTGHSKDVGWLYVEWDTGRRETYRYGMAGAYDVVVCDEPRLLNDQLIAVGCLVTRGPDWDMGNQDGGEGSIGYVYRVQASGVIHVRWPNGESNGYRFGMDGNFDVRLCDPFAPEVQIVLRDQNMAASASSMANESIQKPLQINKGKEDHIFQTEEDREERQVDFSKTTLNIMDMAPPIKHRLSLPEHLDHVSKGDLKSKNNKNEKLTTTKKPTKQSTPSDGQHAAIEETGQNQLQISPNRTESPNAANNNRTCISHEGNLSNSDQITDAMKKDKESHINEEKPVTNESDSDDIKQCDPVHFSDDSSSSGQSEDLPLQWQWKDSNGQWMSYSVEINRKLNKSYKRNPRATVIISLNGQIFRVIFFKDKKINTDTKEEYEIRKMESD